MSERPTRVRIEAVAAAGPETTGRPRDLQQRGESWMTMKSSAEGPSFTGSQESTVQWGAGGRAVELGSAVPIMMRSLGVLSVFVTLALFDPGDGAAQELMGTRIVEPADLRVATGVEGTIRTYFDAPTSTLLNLGLRSTILEPGATPHPTRPHSRVTESLLLVETGTLAVRLSETAEFEEVEAGAAVLLGPNQWHEIRNAASTPVTFFEFAWTSPGMNGEPDYPEEAVNWRRPRQ
jgi:mannose-6-phosphate isomerase-like protein (cupin superfamily)